MNSFCFLVICCNVQFISLVRWRLFGNRKTIGQWNSIKHAEMSPHNTFFLKRIKEMNCDNLKMLFHPI